MLLHGTAIALGSAAVLIRGPSGSGKSDLALRCLALGGTPFAAGPIGLVSDDQVEVTEAGSGSSRILELSAPAAIRGKIEVRGVGIIDMPALAIARLELIVDLVHPEAVERMPEPAFCDINGMQIRRLLLTAFEPSSPLKLILALKGGPK